MTVMVQVRNVPDDVVAALKSRAAAERLSLSDYLALRLEEMAREPTLEELLDQLTKRPRRDLGVTAAELLDEVRDLDDAG